jgi:hypothetical protein
MRGERIEVHLDWMITVKLILIIIYSQEVILGGKLRMI